MSEMNPPTIDVHGLRLQYKHRRMQSKNAMVNHYNSLSLMSNDDFTGIIAGLRSSRKMADNSRDIDFV